MKRLSRICAFLIVLGLLTSVFAGCESLLQSYEYRDYERIARQIEKGRKYTKEKLIDTVGEPNSYKSALDGADYMDSTVTWWRYETTDFFSDVPWGLYLEFDHKGNVSSAEFDVIPGG